MSVATTERGEASRETLWPDVSPTDPDKVAKTYDTYSLKYREAVLKDGWNASFDKVIPVLEDLLSRDNGGTSIVLDAGCGDGLLPELFDFKSRSVRLHGIDVSPGMVTLAKNNSLYEHAEVANLAENLSCSDSLYDIIVSNGVLGYIATAKPIYEFLRILKPGGHVLFTMRVSHFNERGFAKALDELTERCKVLRKEVFSAFPNNSEYTHDYLFVYFQKL